VYLRDYKINLTKEEKYSIALYNGFMGGVINTSCRLHTVPEEMLQLWNFIEPSDKRVTAELPFWSEDKPQIVALKNYPNGKAIFVVNIQDVENSDSYNFMELTGFKNPYVFDWYPEGYQPTGQYEEIEITLKSHESRLLYLSENGDPPPEDLN
ncbi:MAG: hypothetical protein ACP5E3_12440, partial [Bacteroidales bacterium]